MSKYAELRKIDVSEQIEKKGKFNYLSWSHAADLLLQQDPTATWTYHPPLEFNDTMMVFCSVTAFGKTMTSQLPVLDYANKAMKNPDAMAVNTAMQRCLAKAIALHGLGIYIYQGEDLPDISPLETLKETYADKGIDAARVVYAKMSKEDRDQCAEFVATLKAA
jgi:hypothetical protein